MNPTVGSSLFSHRIAIPGPDAGHPSLVEELTSLHPPGHLAGSRLAPWISPTRYNLAELDLRR
jgi:hypothetical protein